MTRTKKFLAAAILGGIGLIGPSVGHAAEIFEPTPGAAIVTPAMNGIDSGGSNYFTATVESAYYGPGLAPTDYVNALNASDPGFAASYGAASSGIYIYAYIVNNGPPSNDPPHALQVLTGSNTIATGEFSDGSATVSATGNAGYTGGVPANVVPAGDNVIFNFGGLSAAPSDPFQSPVLLFATLGTPVLQSAFVTDAGASTPPSLVISDAGPGFAGTPVPTPASAWGGLGLLGLLAGAKLRKARA